MTRTSHGSAFSTMDPANDSMVFVASEFACFSATEHVTNYTFNAPRSGILEAVEMHHVWGNVTCNNARRGTNWGCTPPNANQSGTLKVLMVRHNGDGSEDVVLPTENVTGITSIERDTSCNDTISYYRMEQYDEDSEVLVWDRSDSLFDFYVNDYDTFSLQDTEGWCNVSTSDNGGISCAKVYFKYEHVDPAAPTAAPTSGPTDSPSISPSKSPSVSPSQSPSSAPTASTNNPTSISPSNSPTEEPTSTSAITDEMFIGDEPMNFDDARDYCIDLNTDLVSIHSVEQQEVAEELCSSFNHSAVKSWGCWIGLCLSNDSEWQWLDGSVSDYGFHDNGTATKSEYPWLNNQPDGDEDCVHLYRGSYRWNDLWANWLNVPICKGTRRTSSPTVEPTIEPSIEPTAEPLMAVMAPTSAASQAPTGAPTLDPQAVSGNVALYSFTADHGMILVLVVAVSLCL